MSAVLASPGVEEARAMLAELEGEQAGIPALIHAARRAGETAEWMGLMNREEDLPGEILLARLVLAEAQLVAAKALVPAAETEATRLRAEAKALSEGVKAKQERAAALHLEAQADLLRAPRMGQEANAVVGRALVDVDDAAAAVSRLRGELGSRADTVPATAEPGAVERRLSGSIELRHPRSGEPVTFLRGTVPPSWAAAQIGNPKAWAPTATPTAAYTTADDVAAADDDGPEAA